MAIELEDLQKSVLGVAMANYHDPTTQGYQIYQQLLIDELDKNKPNTTQITAFIKEGTKEPAGYVIETNDEIIVCYRGTLTSKEALNDLDISYRTIESNSHKYGLHSGFKREYEASLKSLEKVLENHKNKPITFAGHSLGGAVATIAALDFETRSNSNSPGKEKLKIKAVATFGSPRVLLTGAAKLYNDIGLGKKTIRVEQKYDPIPKVPPYGFYQHVGRNIQMHAGSWQTHSSNAYHKIVNKIGSNIIKQEPWSINGYAKEVFKIPKELFLAIQTKAIREIKNLLSTPNKDTELLHINNPQTLDNKTSITLLKTKSLSKSRS